MTEVRGVSNIPSQVYSLFFCSAIMLLFDRKVMRVDLYSPSEFDLTQACRSLSVGASYADKQILLDPTLLTTPFPSVQEIYMPAPRMS
jgi:hypothetical protein